MLQDNRYLDCSVDTAPACRLIPNPLGNQSQLRAWCFASECGTVNAVVLPATQKALLMVGPLVSKRSAQRECLCEPSRERFAAIKEKNGHFFFYNQFAGTSQAVGQTQCVARANGLCLMGLQMLQAVLTAASPLSSPASNSHI